MSNRYFEVVRHKRNRCIEKGGVEFKGAEFESNKEVKKATTAKLNDETTLSNANVQQEPQEEAYESIK